MNLVTAILITAATLTDGSVSHEAGPDALSVMIAPERPGFARGAAAPLPAMPPGPVNDACVDAIAVAVPSVTSGTNDGAALEPEVGPDCGTTIDVGGVWFAVTGTGNTMTVTTCPLDDVQPGSADFDTKLSVFCGTCAGPGCIDGSDGGCSFFPQATVSWCSNAGEQYLVLVHGALGEQGNFELSVYDDGRSCGDPAECALIEVGACCIPGAECLETGVVTCAEAGGVYQGADTTCVDIDCLDLVPANDACTDAAPLAAPSQTDGSTIFATIAGVPLCVSGIDSPGVWYTVQGTGNTLTATTCSGDPVAPGDADFDTKLTVYCGDCNTSDCCVSHGAPGCDDSVCEDTVCTVDPFCCDVQWDEICAAQTLYLCDDLCGPVFCVTENDDGCDTVLLQSTARWCSEPGRTYYVLVHGFDDSGNFTLSVYDDGIQCETAVPCEACVYECPAGGTLEIEPNCGMPADDVNGGCDSPIGVRSDCCVGGSDPGCDDPACTAIVCATDPFCCQEQWDDICAAAAVEVCDTCEDIVYPMMPISCGESYCSTAGASGVMRDVDWYKLQIAEESLVEVTATCGFSALFGIIDNGGIDSCVGLTDFRSVAISEPCTREVVTAFLPAGTWYLIIAPSSFAPLECQTDYEFSVACSRPGACCFEDGTCELSDELPCAAAGGVYLGLGSGCLSGSGAVSSFTSAPNETIPDGDPIGITDTIVVDESFVVGEVTVDVNISHTWIADLDIALTHEPTGTTATLWRLVCDGAQHLIVTFDDGGEAVECSVPTTGVLAPLAVNGTRLSVFEGLDAGGPWTLHVDDRIAPDGGTLLDWALHLEAGEAIDCRAPIGRCCPGCVSDCADTNGSVDAFDLMALLGGWGEAGACAGNDDVVGFDDLLKLLASWGACPQCSVTTRGACEQLDGEWAHGADCSSPCD